MKTALLIVVSHIIAAYCWFIVGQDHPLEVPLSGEASIVCPMGGTYTLTRGYGTVSLRCNAE